MRFTCLGVDFLEKKNCFVSNWEYRTHRRASMFIWVQHDTEDVQGKRCGCWSHPGWSDAGLWLGCVRVQATARRVVCWKVCGLRRVRFDRSRRVTAPAPTPLCVTINAHARSSDVERDCS
jgi:hypothetical protein